MRLSLNDITKVKSLHTLKMLFHNM